MKRTMNRLFARLAILCVAVILGAFAVSQAQNGLNNPNAAANGAEAPPVAQVTQPIPPADFAANDPYEQLATSQDAASTYAPSTSGYGGEENSYAPEEPDFAQDPPAGAYADSAPAGYGDQGYADAAGYGATANGNDAYLDPTEEPDYGGGYAAETTDLQDVDPVAKVQYLAEAAPDLPPALPPVQSLPPALDPPAANLNDTYAPEMPAAATAYDLPPIESLTPTAAAAPPVAIVPDPPVTQQVGYPNDAYATQPAVSPNVATQITPISEFAQVPEPASNSYGGPVGAATLNVGNERNRNNNFAEFPSRPERMANLSRSTGSGKPGPVALEGPQSPTLVVTKNAPPEVQVGKVAKFEVTVRNVGAVDAKDVVIRDEVPEGAQLVETIPAAGKSANGGLIWEVGTIKGGGEVTVVMQIMPTAEGDIGSVATVSFQAAASAKSIATRPQLTLEHTGPGQVLVGNDVIFHIKLSNPGTGVANNVVVTEQVPPGLRHVDGRSLEYQIGTMRPGETRLLELTLKADQAGMVDNLLLAKADSNLQVEDRCPVEIIAPAIRVAIEGPRRRYLERRATFQLKVANPGTAPAKEVELIAQLPHGLKFVSTNNAGQYNSQNHTVRWSLAELPAKEMGVVELTAIPEEVGSQRIRVETNAQMNLTDAADHEVVVEGLAAILFTVTDATDPIEVGGQTTYDIRIVNQGSKIGTNVRMAALIPEGMTAVNGEGPTRAVIEGQRVMFEPITKLAPQADAQYKIHVKGMTPGDKRIQVQLLSDSLQQPVTKEESTHVYSDQ